MVDYEIKNYSYGFVKHLLKILDDDDNKIKKVSNKHKIFMIDDLCSMYGKENLGQWFKDYASYYVISNDIKNR